MPCVMVHNSVSSEKGRHLILSSTCSRIRTSLDSFCWNILIDFFNVGSFTHIGTYVEYHLSFLFLGGVTLPNTTLGSITSFSPSLKYILSFSLHFFGVPVSSLPLYPCFLVMMGSFARVYYDQIILLLTFFPIYVFRDFPTLFGLSFL